VFGIAELVCTFHSCFLLNMVLYCRTLLFHHGVRECTKLNEWAGE